MTDYPKALAAARKRVQIINSLRPELLDDNEIAIRDLVAALDAARGEAVWQYRATSQGQTWVDCRDEQIARTMKANGFEIRCLYAAPPAALAVPAGKDWQAEAMRHAQAALYWRERCEMLEDPVRKAQQPAAAVPPGGLRDSVLNSAKFRASCYALVGIVEGIEGLGRNWAANGERLKDTPEWVAFYNCVAAMRNGTFDPASAEQAPPAALAVPAANVTPMRQPRLDLSRLVESIKDAVYANGDGLSVTECIGALELAKLELFKEQEK